MIIIYLISVLFFIILFCSIPHIFYLAQETNLGEKLLEGNIWAFLFILIISFVPLARFFILLISYDIF